MGRPMAGDRQLLIDGDILCYRFAHSNEYNIQWDENTESKVVQEEAALIDVHRFVDELMEKTKALSLWVIFSGANNFRYKVLSSYKHNRVGLEKPELHATIKASLKASYPYKEKDGLEGDDVLGIMSTLECPDPDTRLPEVIVASIDKDLMQIPGHHYNWNTGKHLFVSEEDGDWWFYRQVLTGDPGDGYSGCPKIGPKRAEHILTDAQRYAGAARRDDQLNTVYWEAVVSTYFKAGLTEADALVQARVARILRANDYNFKKGEPILWTPVSSAT